jgi:hypothetical protein
MRTLLLSLLFAVSALAQETVVPTVIDQVGPARGDNKGDYNVVQSWELGYRYSLVGGDEGKYRSDVNFGNGIRLLNSFLTVNSRDGKGKLFDEIILTTHGLGNDPYESVTLRIQKNKLYTYDFQWRLNSYFNPGLDTARGLHLQNTQQRWQDQNLTLFPDNKIRFKAGYSRNSEDGPALTTSNLFENERGDIFPVFSNVKRVYNSYRLGTDIDFWGFRLSVLRRWELYREDTPYSLTAPQLGYNLTDVSKLTGFNRSAPIHGDTPGWLVHLSTEKRKYAVNGRFGYTGGNHNFVMNESAIGTGLLGTENRLVITYGDAKRPVTNADLNLSYFPTAKITVTNNTSVNDTRIVGNSFYEQFDLATLSASTQNFQYLGIVLVTNSTDAHYHATKKLDFFGGYRYATRDIKSIQSTTDPNTPFTNTVYTQTNKLYAGVAGLNWIVASPLRLHLETEIGRNDNPFTLVSDKNYHKIDGRLQYKRKSIFATAGYKETYNNDSITLTSYSSHARNYFSSFNWAAKSWVSVDANYAKLHLDTLGGLTFFAGTPRSTLQTGQSIYVSNIHAATLGLRFDLMKHADLYLGYNITLDAGDGRSSLLAPGTTTALLYNVQTFPLKFQSPLLRLTVPVTKKIKWNAGYQYYGYREDFGINSVLQNYHALTGYTSLLWAF